MMQAAQQRGQRVHVWTVDDPDEGRRLQQLGVNALITNRPKGLRTELDL
jgi:glycerophosphoryl diester phosphodiesterase